KSLVIQKATTPYTISLAAGKADHTSVRRIKLDKQEKNLYSYDMNFIKKIRQNRWFSFFSNIYVIVLTVFAVWMIFFDTNSLLTHIELEKEIDKLQKQKEYLQKEIEQDKEVIRNLKDDGNIKKFAREEYYFRKENEEIYIIERQDSITWDKKKAKKE